MEGSGRFILDVDLQTTVDLRMASVQVLRCFRHNLMYRNQLFGLRRAVDDLHTCPLKELFHGLQQPLYTVINGPCLLLFALTL